MQVIFRVGGFAVLLLVFWLASVACAAPAAAATGADDPPAVSTGLQRLDWVLIGVYACTTLGIGWYYGRKQRSTEEYFLGSGNMNPLLIGVSLFATLLSTISYLGAAGEVIGKGPVILTTLISLPLVYFIVAYWLLPMYMRQRVTSAYELLELKLGVGIRLLGASMFVLMRLFWMSLLVYLAAKAMVVMMGIKAEHIPTVVFYTGLIAVVYTSIGGLRAVVVTDCLQTLLLFGGALLVVASVTIEMGGFGWFPTSWHPSWDAQPVFSLDPKTRVTVVGSLLSFFVWYVCTLGGDQTAIQRFMATRDAATARWACAVQLTVTVVVTVTLGLVGMALLGYFEAHPERLPVGMTLQQDADFIFPRYIAYHLPVGVAGLVVSAMFAAAMSSIDSGINSITAVVTSDFLDRFGRSPKTERGHLMFSRVMAFSIGTIVVLCSSLVAVVPGNITEVTNKTVNLLPAPIFGLFFFALFVPFARPAGVWAGTICGVLMGAIVAFSGPLVTLLDLQFGIPAATFGVELLARVDSVTGVESVIAEDPISFQWIAPLALLVDVVVGLAVSWGLSKRDG